MPMYAYKCHTCDEHFEKRLSFSQSSQLPPCPTCAGADTTKLLARVNINGFAAPKKKGASIPLTMNRMASSCCGGGACGCQAAKLLSASKQSR